MIPLRRAPPPPSIYKANDVAKLSAVSLPKASLSKSVSSLVDIDVISRHISHDEKRKSPPPRPAPPKVVPFAGNGMQMRIKLPGVKLRKKQQSVGSKVAGGVGGGSVYTSSWKGRSHVDGNLFSSSSLIDLQSEPTLLRNYCQMTNSSCAFDQREDYSSSSNSSSSAASSDEESSGQSVGNKQRRAQSETNFIYVSGGRSADFVQTMANNNSYTTGDQFSAATTICPAYQNQRPPLLNNGKAAADETEQIESLPMPNIPPPPPPPEVLDILANGSPPLPPYPYPNTSTSPPEIMQMLRIAEYRIALYDYCGTRLQDLSFKEGSYILVTGRINHQWLYGQYGGKCGEFPADFVTDHEY